MREAGYIHRRTTVGDAWVAPNSDTGPNNGKTRYVMISFFEKDFDRQKNYSLLFTRVIYYCAQINFLT
jgi:hypothetical protein